MKTEIPLVSIILTVYNQEKTIARCIESLIRQDYSRKKVIVVDDGSVDKTAEIVSKYDVKLIRSKHEHKPKALNRALKMARGEIIAVAEGDAIYDQDYLSNCIKNFKDQRVGGVMGKLRTLNPTSIVSRSIEAYRRVRWDLVGKPDTAWVYRRKAIEAIGGFDETQYYPQDAAAGIQLQNAGYRIAFEPKAVWWHTEPENLAWYLKKQFKWGIGTIPFLIKYYRVGIRNPHVWKRLRDISAILGLTFVLFFLLSTGKPTYAGDVIILAFAYQMMRTFNFYFKARKVTGDSLASFVFPWLSLLGKFAGFLGFTLGLLLKLMRRDLLKYA